jgi:anthranilate phosphoribosyltransferase
VVWGRDGMDEITLGDTTLVGELRGNEVREYEIHPRDFGLAVSASDALRVHDAAQSRLRVLEALEDKPGPVRDIVLLNAGAALFVAELADSIAAGIQKARAAVASGAARSKLDRFVAATRRIGGRSG